MELKTPINLQFVCQTDTGATIQEMVLTTVEEALRVAQGNAELLQEMKRTFSGFAAMTDSMLYHLAYPHAKAANYEA